MTTFERIQKIVAEQSVVGDIVNVTPTSTLKDDLQYDDLDHIELAMALEDEFDLSVPDGDLDGLGTVGEVAGYIEQRLAR